MKIIEANKDNFANEVLNESKIVLVDFNANWCGPCRMLKPILEELSDELEEIKFISVNIDDEDQLAAKYEVSSIPCLITFKDGKEVNRSVGFKSKDDIKEFLEVK